MIDNASVIAIRDDLAACRERGDFSQLLPRQVHTAVGEMDNVTQQNAAMVEQATAAARSLSSEADRLALQVSRFAIDAKPPSGASTPQGAQAPARLAA